MCFKKFACLVLAAVLLVTCLPAPAVGALTAEEAKAERDRLQQELIQINSKLAAIKDDVKKAEEKANTYGQRVGIVEEQIDLLKESIELKNQELAAKQALLDETIRQQEETYEAFKSSLRAMYMAGETSALEALLSSSSFSEFLVNADAMRRISQHDNDLLEKLAEEQKLIEQQKKEIEEERQVLLDEEAELQTKYNELAALYREADAELSSVEALQEVTQADYDAILDEFNRMDAEWNSIIGGGSQVGDQYVGNYFAWPVPGYTWISSYYGWRKLYGKDNWHGGIDIAGSGIYGAPIIASDTGRVRTAGYNAGGYGNYVIIDHGGGYWTVYGHMSSIAVSYGEWVGQGQTIGYVGSTGNSTGPHLHFEIRVNNERVNPLDYLAR